jgi:phosphoglycerate dehydrogenase-like enzyme/glyoxylase-like metal-dependent hydrolase (beta-lactamase superfamily II)
MRVAGLLAFALLFILSRPLSAADDLPKMKFNDVHEVAKGVYFRYSSISATDDKIPFGGCNNIWVVFEDYVVVIDANFPKEAGDVIAAVKKTTDKPIRYVFDTHHHGDHAYGNAVFAKEGAGIIAQRNCARLLRVNGPKEFEDAGKGATGRKDIRESKLKVPNVVFDDKLVLDDGTQRVEFLFLGHGHTPGDAVAYLPKHKILCTGDACVNGAYNFMGHSDSASWIRALERMQQLDVNVVCPGHGPLAGKEVIAKQKRYFVELRSNVKKGIEAHHNAEEIHKEIDLPWYKEWTGVKPTKPNVEYVYDEMTGRVAPWDFSEDFGLLEGASPTKETTGWTKPKRIVVPSGLMPARLGELKRIAPDVEFVPARTIDEAVKEISEADGVLGFCSDDLVKAGKKLRWIQFDGFATDKQLTPAVVESKITLTRTADADGPQTADRALGLLLDVVRKTTSDKERGPHELHGKTMVLVGLDGTGTLIARRAWASGMRVRAVDSNREQPRPDFVFSLDRMEKLGDLLRDADVVVVACPLTSRTKGLFDGRQLARMKKTAYLINVGRSKLVVWDDLVDALRKKTIAGAGWGVIDAMPDGASSVQMDNLSMTAGNHSSPEAAARQWRLVRENVRRFVAGERLLCVIER